MHSRIFFCAFAALILSVSAAYADVCVAPGDIVITDPAGDVIDPMVPPDPVSAVADLVSLSVATPAAASIDDQTVVFSIKTNGTAPAFPPGSGIFSSFLDPRQTVRGVRIEGAQTGGFIYYSYEVAANTSGAMSGSLVVAGSTKPAQGTYAGGLITITVKATDIGIRGTGDTLSGFNGSSFLFTGAGASRIDDMPDNILDRSLATPVTYSPCTKSGKAADAQGGVEDKSGTNFGGAFAPGLLTLFIGFAGLRRRFA